LNLLYLDRIFIAANLANDKVVGFHAFIISKCSFQSGGILPEPEKTGDR
jgi:hypothetical protein